MNEFGFVCTACKRNFPLHTVNSKCKSCNEPLELKFDVTAVPENWFETQRSNLFSIRYAPFYPYLDPVPSVSLGEGQTTLLNSIFAAQKIGLRALFFKNETQNPTWTFKDRGSICSIHNAIRLGYQRFGTLSSGNMGASVAAYGSRSGMNTVIILKENVPIEKIEALAIYGAKAIQVIGDYAELYTKLLEIGNDHQIYFSLSDDPLRVEGYKSLSFELYEQLNGRLPDFLSVPLGSGGLFRGILKGFEELKASGIVAEIPKMIGVQTEGNSPVVDAFQKEADRIEHFPNAATLDHVLENPYPPSGNQVLRKLKTNGGLLVKVDNEAVLTAIRLLAQEGIFAQPASATSLAGVIRAVEKGQIQSDATAVAVITGTGLKHPPVLKKFQFSPLATHIGELSRAFENVFK